MRIRVGGAGNKVLQVLEGNADVYLSLSKRVKYWDTCAGHALVHSRFGLVNDKDGNEITYNPNTKNFSLDNGMIMSRTAGFKHAVWKRLSNWCASNSVEEIEDVKGVKITSKVTSTSHLQF